MIPLRELIYGVRKNGIYSTRRYPWGKAGRDEKGNPTPGINEVEFDFRTIAGISFTALPADNGLKSLEIQNLSTTNDIAIGFGMRASATSGLVLTPGQTHIWDVAVPQDSIDIFCLAANQRVNIIKGR